MPPKKTKAKTKRRKTKAKKRRQQQKRKQPKRHGARKPRRKAPKPRQKRRVEIPVMTTRRGSCEEIFKEYKSNQQIAAGQDSNVFAMCDPKGQCPYVLRVEDVPFVELALRDREVKITQIASNHGIGPKLLDAWYWDPRTHMCSDPRVATTHARVFMVFERLDNTLDHVLKHEWRGKDQKELQ